MIFRIIALLLMAIFYICYYSKMIIQKKKGIKTSQIGRGKTGFVKGIECTMMVSTIFAIVMFHLQIVNVEEDFLLEVFGQEYLDYKKTVNRYLGRRMKVTDY